MIFINRTFNAAPSTDKFWFFLMLEIVGFRNWKQEILK
jgi:hypothetical protein